MNLEMKNPTSFRLSPEALRLIAKLSKGLAVSKTSVVELAVRVLDHQQRKP